MNWGDIPIIYDNLKQVSDTTMARNTQKSVWEFIIRDLRYAVKNLPETPIAQGRLSKWSAKAMLARMYLYHSGFGSTDGTRNQAELDSAKLYAGDVCENSGLSLLDSYYDLFKVENENSGESLFALQWETVGTEWGTQNTFQAYMAYDSKIAGVGDGWGGGHGASSDIMHYYEDNPTDLRRRATFFFNGDHYDDLMTKSGGLDYTIDFIANVRKYIVGSADEGKVLFMRTELNTYMMRLAELYLIYADAILGNDASTNNEDALKYFNLVRKRAGLTSLTSISYDDIMKEKRIELAMEGNYWYDLVRLYYFNPTKAKEIINGQDKGPYTVEYDTVTKVRKISYPEVDWQGTPYVRYYSFTDDKLFLPYPESEMAKCPNLRKDPVDFDFSKLDE